MSFLERLQEAAVKMAEGGDPWTLRLERVRGKVGDDGIERISTQTVFDHLEVLQRCRGAMPVRLIKSRALKGGTLVRGARKLATLSPASML
jgi:hypothetical protein